jgi:hypothetical protein
MEDSPLKSQIRALCISLSQKDNGTEEKELVATLRLYNKQSPSQMYADMIAAQSILFGGKIDLIRSGVNLAMPDNTDEEKAGFIATGMREHLEQIVKTLPGDPVINLMYRTILEAKPNLHHVWECLFTAATYYKEVMVKEKGVDPLPRKWASVLMNAFSEEAGALYGTFDPTPVREAPVEDTSVSSPAQITPDGPKGVQ